MRRRSLFAPEPLSPLRGALEVLYEREAQQKAELFYLQESIEGLKSCIAREDAEAVELLTSEQVRALEDAPPHVPHLCGHGRMCDEPPSPRCGPGCAPYDEAMASTPAPPEQETPKPGCSWCGMIGVQHVDPCEPPSRPGGSR